MSSILFAILTTSALFLGVIACIELGFRIGRRSRSDDPESITRGVGGLEAAVFGLLGLLIAFIFSGAASRYENRRQLIINEANAIGTASLRLDLLPDADRDALRRLFRDYLDARIACHQSLREGEPDSPEAQRVNQLQQQIWTTATSALKKQNSAPATQLLIPALNEMFDIGASRIAATQIHAPGTIVLLMFATVLLASTLAGYGMSARQHRARLHTLIFALAMTVTVYVTLDLELPRSGLIRIDALDHLLTDLRKSM